MKSVVYALMLAVVVFSQAWGGKESSQGAEGSGGDLVTHGKAFGKAAGVTTVKAGRTVGTTTAKGGKTVGVTAAKGGVVIAKGSKTVGATAAKASVETAKAGNTTAQAVGHGAKKTGKVIKQGLGKVL